MTETTAQTSVQTPVPEAVSHADGSAPPPAVNHTGEHDGDPENGSQSPDGSKASREAARYRTERNTAREELAISAARIERMQRADIERLAADGLSHPSDLFSLSGNEVADYLTEDGDVDAEKVAADVAAVLAERPGLRRNSPAHDPSQGLGGRAAPPPRIPSLADLLKQESQPY